MRHSLIVLATLVTLSACAGAVSPSPATTVTAPPELSTAASSPANGSSRADESTAPAPSSSPSPATRIAWTETGSFGTDDTISTVSGVTHGPTGIVAVGTHYDSNAWNVFGPRPPHSGRVWLSADGGSWEAVDTPDVFDDVTLHGVFPTADSALIAHGTIGDSTLHEFDGSPYVPHAAWESLDGRSWHRMSGGLPEDRQVSVVRNDRGHLALTYDAAGRRDLWFSADGRNWALANAGPPAPSQVAAGDEGFVVITGGGRVFASSDGREWIEASAQSEMNSVAAIGPDWFGAAVSVPAEGAEPTAVTVWFSPNGLEWSERGQLRLGAEPPCWVLGGSLSGAGGWLFMHTTLGYPCSEGAVVTAGITYLSADGVTWETLPFPGDSSHAIVAVDGVLIAAGQSGNRATFWIGQPQ
jgi:YD repeat-containing protein